MKTGTPAAGNRPLHTRKSNEELQYNPVGPRVKYTQNRQWDWNRYLFTCFHSNVIQKNQEPSRLSVKAQANKTLLFTPTIEYYSDFTRKAAVTHAAS